MNTIAVIGGGISGLTCAWNLRQQGLPVILLERGPRCGGVIDTVEKNGFLFDVGPQSFLAVAPMQDLIDELGLAAELLKADPRAPRYILSGGKLLPAPLGPLAFLRTPLVGWRTKLRLAGEPLFRGYPPDEEESIADFVRRKAGEDLLDNLVAPFVSGIYAGDPEKLSVSSAFPGVRQLEERYGSVIRGLLNARRAAKAKGGGARPALCNFKRGMTTLTGALAEKLGDAVVANAEIVAIRRFANEGGSTNEGANNAAKSAAGRGFHIEYYVGGAARSLDVRTVIVATPTQDAARLLAEIEPRLGEALSRIEYASVAQVATGYRVKQISWRTSHQRQSTQAGQLEQTSQPQGFGFLVPRSEHLRILGTVWSSSLFSGRAPGIPSGTAGEKLEETASFTSFVGGATDPEICRQSEDEIAQIVSAELARVLSICGPPVAMHVARRTRALPQYNLGHSAVIATVKELCGAIPGLFLTGNYLSGPSLGACVEQARIVADSVKEFVAAQT